MGVKIVCFKANLELGAGLELELGTGPHLDFGPHAFLQSSL